MTAVCGRHVPTSLINVTREAASRVITGSVGGASTGQSARHHPRALTALTHSSRPLDDVGRVLHRA